ncbi:hypothetical protein C1Y08_29965 [Pseudomonas sp. FW306-02-F02-AA]|uniref:Uncharacterized protein n=1 Tax=Pseudomonas fluorescens TaxID=294 RepID=A0A0N9VKL6_PSEFL|nr:hypothetical protein AO353_04760 [Pseudomonas fluorescens]PMZ00489.1 hypothetical protein C1Y07_30135 [Pseudomonas sp. FW306-02-F02-AB]PMZ06393.1 hypothetical protein C1Y06_30060 [Pseudomonas sp. FW306-02-H06C]PMZ12262.1 hypothetical protein C1Y08_29965 [Pseudomonas sp. FW306-02-F02-AA]PMZ18265.1 hypothetical protein C1Y09_30195 [Pseudomonas sp. FW306-02-F08-AA]PMZ25282.1 hypothetical protein C1Y05_24630 [Pseudomonas sp. FW306-02-F04-BA]PMZ30703.1 hypothetical protein C1X99_30080 [Pseudomo
MSEEKLDVAATPPPNMESPFKDMAYDSPLWVVGRSEFGASSPGVISLALLTYQPFSEYEYAESAEAKQGSGGDYVHNKPLPPGPCSLVIQYHKRTSSPPKDEDSVKYNTGMFYIRTAPE